VWVRPRSCYKQAAISNVPRTAWLAALTAPLLGLLAACSTSSISAPDSIHHGVREDCTADWNDVDAAMEVAASKVEMAVVSQSLNSDNERVYKMRTSLDEPAWVIATRAAATNDGERITIQLRATVGRFGDARREEQLLAAARKRLDELCGVSTSPLKE
jgi:hypothetical protein